MRPSSDSSLSTASMASSNDIPTCGFGADNRGNVVDADDEDAPASAAVTDADPDADADADADDEEASDAADDADDEDASVAVATDEDDEAVAEEFDIVEEYACLTGTDSK